VGLALTRLPDGARYRHHVAMTGRVQKEPRRHHDIRYDERHDRPIDRAWSELVTLTASTLL
jgi:hypothetical protein